MGYSGGGGGDGSVCVCVCGGGGGEFAYKKTAYVKNVRTPFIR